MIIVIIILVIVGLSLYLLSLNMNKETLNGLREEVTSALELGLEQEEQQKLKVRKRELDTPDINTHPLENFSLISKKLENYAHIAAKKIKDNVQKEQFLNELQNITFQANQINVNELIKTIDDFLPLKNSFLINLEKELAFNVEAIIKDINYLSQEPSMLESLSLKVNALLKFINLFNDLVIKWQDSKLIGLNEQKIQELLDNNLQIVSNQELFNLEVNSLMNLYFIFQTFQILENTHDEKLEALGLKIANIEKTLKKKVSLDELDKKEISNLQKAFLEDLHVIHEYYQKLYNAFLLAFEKFLESRFKAFNSEKAKIELYLETIQKDYLPIIEKFTVRNGDGSKDCNKLFQKVLDNRTISNSTIENLIAYLKSRIEDILSLKNSEIKLFMYKNIQVIYDQLASHQETS